MSVTSFTTAQFVNVNDVAFPGWFPEQKVVGNTSFMRMSPRDARLKRACKLRAKEMFGSDLAVPRKHFPFLDQLVSLRTAASTSNVHEVLQLSSTRAKRRKARKSDAHIASSIMEVTAPAAQSCIGSPIPACTMRVLFGCKRADVWVEMRVDTLNYIIMRMADDICRAANGSGNDENDDDDGDEDIDETQGDGEPVHSDVNESDASTSERT